MPFGWGLDRVLVVNIVDVRGGDGFTECGTVPRDHRLSCMPEGHRNKEEVRWPFRHHAVKFEKSIGRVLFPLTSPVALEVSRIIYLAGPRTSDEIRSAHRTIIPPCRYTSYDACIACLWILLTS